MKRQAIFFLFVCSSILQDSTAVDLQFSFILSSSGVDPVYGVSLASTVPAVDLALDYINSNSTLLPGYNLKYATILQSKCGYRPALDTFFHSVLSQTNLGVVGCTCSETTKAIAGVINYSNIPQIVCNPVAVHSASSDSLQYEYLLKLHPQAVHYAAAVATFVQHFGWRRMAILSQTGDFYSEVDAILRELLEMGNISVIGAQHNMSADAKGESQFFPQDVRVFFLNSNISHVKYILCKAHALKMLFPKYIWLTYSDESRALFSRDRPQCDERVLVEAVQGLFTLSSVAPTDKGSGMLERVYRASNVSYTPLAKFAYDSVLTLATLLNRTLTIMENGDLQHTGCRNRNGTRVHLDEFSYDNDVMGCLFLRAMQNFSFDGISDYISFNSFGEREHISIKVYQLKGPNYHTSTYIADINVSTNVIVFVQGINSSGIFRELSN